MRKRCHLTTCGCEICIALKLSNSIRATIYLRTLPIIVNIESNVEKPIYTWIKRFLLAFRFIPSPLTTTIMASGNANKKKTTTRTSRQRPPPRRQKSNGKAMACKIGQKNVPTSSKRKKNSHRATRKKFSKNNKKNNCNIENWKSILMSKKLLSRMTLAITSSSKLTYCITRSASLDCNVTTMWRYWWTFFFYYHSSSNVSQAIFSHSWFITVKGTTAHVFFSSILLFFCECILTAQHGLLLLHTKSHINWLRIFIITFSHILTAYLAYRNGLITI